MIAINHHDAATASVGRAVARRIIGTADSSPGPSPAMALALALDPNRAAVGGRVAAVARHRRRCLRPKGTACDARTAHLVTAVGRARTGQDAVAAPGDAELARTRRAAPASAAAARAGAAPRQVEEAGEACRRLAQCAPRRSPCTWRGGRFHTSSARARLGTGATMPDKHEVAVEPCPSCRGRVAAAAVALPQPATGHTAAVRVAAARARVSARPRLAADMRARRARPSAPPALGALPHPACTSPTSAAASRCRPPAARPAGGLLVACDRR